VQEIYRISEAVRAGDDFFSSWPCSPGTGSTAHASATRSSSWSSATGSAGNERHPRRHWRLKVAVSARGRNASPRSARELGDPGRRWLKSADIGERGVNAARRVEVQGTGGGSRGNGLT